MSWTRWIKKEKKYKVIERETQKKRARKSRRNNVFISLQEFVIILGSTSTSNQCVQWSVSIFSFFFLFLFWPSHSFNQPHQHHHHHHFTTTRLQEFSLLQLLLYYILHYMKTCFITTFLLLFLLFKVNCQCNYLISIKTIKTK